MDDEYDDQNDCESDGVFNPEDDDGFDYDEFVEREFGGSSGRSGGGLTNRNTKFLWRLTAVILLILYLLYLI